MDYDALRLIRRHPLVAAPRSAGICLTRPQVPEVAYRMTPDYGIVKGEPSTLSPLIRNRIATIYFEDESSVSASGVKMKKQSWRHEL